MDSKKTSDSDDRIAVVDEEELQQPIEVMAQIREHMNDLERRRQQSSDEDTDKADLPEEIGAAVLKYHKKAEISRKLEEHFDNNVAFFGTHIVNSNTRRIDNLRELGYYDSTTMVRRIPYMRQYGTNIKVRVTSEYQMCRSNPEIGGFDQKMSRTSITKEDVDVRQKQSVDRPGEKRGGVLGFLGFRKKQ